MEPIRRILVPVDFSECSREALHRAIAFARPFHASLDVLHVWMVPAYVSPTLAIQIAQTKDTTTLEAIGREEAEEQMSRFLESIERPTDVPITPTVEAGEPLGVVLARSKDADLVIAGTHGRTGLSHFLLGSVAEKIVRLSEKPVLTIRSLTGHPDAPTQKIAKNLQFPPKRILVPVDFSSSSKLALEAALSVQTMLGAKVEVLHAVTHVPIEGAELLVSGYAGESKTPFREWARSRADEEMKAFLASVKGGERADVRVLLGEPVATVLEESTSGRYDLVVIGTHGRTGVSRLIMGSVAERIVRRSPCPVLTVREPHAAA
ncbi:universal stress protein [Myxococcota bacterium]|nr:universal stress protein [Myxococcota bacterium]